MGVWFVGVWVCECVGVWVCECVGVGECEYVCMCGNVCVYVIMYNHLYYVVV